MVYIKVFLLRGKNFNGPRAVEQIWWLRTSLAGAGLISVLKNRYSRIPIISYEVHRRKRRSDRTTKKEAMELLTSKQYMDQSLIGIRFSLIITSISCAYTMSCYLTDNAVGYSLLKFNLSNQLKPKWKSFETHQSASLRIGVVKWFRANYFDWFSEVMWNFLHIRIHMHSLSGINFSKRSLC